MITAIIQVNVNSSMFVSTVGDFEHDILSLHVWEEKSIEIYET